MDKWLYKYGHSHQNIKFPLIFWPAVILFAISTIGLLWSIKLVDIFQAPSSSILNLGLIFISATIIYYFVISKMLAVGMIPFIIGIIVIFLWLENTDYPIISILIGLNITSLYGLFRGRKQDNNFASLMNDVQMIIIGPLWMLSKLYKKIGIPK